MDNMDAAQFSINQPPITYENIDGEVIIINLNNGYYYSLHHVGAVIWSLIESRTTQLEMIDLIAHHYNRSKQEISSMIISFLDELQAEDLISVQTHQTLENKKNIKLNTTDEFTPPQLEKYEDKFRLKVVID